MRNLNLILNYFCYLKNFKRTIGVFILFLTMLFFNTAYSNEISQQNNESFIKKIKIFNSSVTNALDFIKKEKTNSVGFFKDEIPFDKIKLTSDKFLIFIATPNELVTGTITKRDLEGNIIEMTEAKNGLYHGEYKRYHSPYQNRLIKIEGKYKKGAKNGKWKEYFENGEIYKIINYKGNLKNGKYEEYYSRNNELKEEGEYKKGLKNGKWTFYHPNGSKKAQGKYENDKKIKSWTYFDSNGNEVETKRYTWF